VTQKVVEIESAGMLAVLGKTTEGGWGNSGGRNHQLGVGRANVQKVAPDEKLGLF